MLREHLFNRITDLPYISRVVFEKWHATEGATIAPWFREPSERLLKIRRSDTHQSKIVARFLLSLYNGGRFHFDLSEFRCVDNAIFQDCLLVLAVDTHLVQEVHRYFDNGGEIWEQMAAAWKFKNHRLGSWR